MSVSTRSTRNAVGGEEAVSSLQGGQSGGGGLVVECLGVGHRRRWPSGRSSAPGWAAREACVVGWHRGGRSCLRPPAHGRGCARARADGSDTGAALGAPSKGQPETACDSPPGPVAASSADARSCAPAAAASVAASAAGGPSGRPFRPGRPGGIAAPSGPPSGGTPGSARHPGDRAPVTDDAASQPRPVGPGQRRITVGHEGPPGVWLGPGGSHPKLNRPGIDGGFQPLKDGSHGGTEEVPRSGSGAGHPSGS